MGKSCVANPIGKTYAKVDIHGTLQPSESYRDYALFIPKTIR